MVSKERYLEIGQRIKGLREARNIEQGELASMLGYKSQTTVSKLELGIN